MSDTSEHLHRSSMEHVFHVWMNKRQEANKPGGLPWEHDLYEWTNAVREMERLPNWLKRARTGDLPTVHQQCSHSVPEPIEKNTLMCALGMDVTECAILKSLYALFEEYGHQEHYSELTAGDADLMGARVCCWHIFRTIFRINPETMKFIDTSEGYVQDESDRRFWATVYEHLSANDPDEEPEEVPEDVKMRLQGEPPLPGLEEQQSS